MGTAGHDFWYMWQLVQRAYVGTCTDDWVAKTFSPAMMLAISWEETQFGNIRQLGFTHADWMKRWNEALPNGKPKLNAAGQIVGNHAIGFVQVERDTIDLWLSLNPRLCLGLPGFTLDMAFDLKSPNVTPAQKDARRIWWQGLDEAILGDEVAGFGLGWRALSHLHFSKVAGTKRGALQAYAGKNKERDDPKKKLGRTAPQIIQGWLDTDAIMRALGQISPYRMQADLGLKFANRAIAGAYWYSRPDGDFPTAFGGTTMEEAAAMARVYHPFVTRGPSDSFVGSSQIAALREAIRAHLGFDETA